MGVAPPLDVPLLDALRLAVLPLKNLAVAIAVAAPRFKSSGLASWAPFFLCDAKFIINLSVLKDVGHNTLGVIELLFLQQSIVLKRPWASYTLAALHPPCR